VIHRIGAARSTELAVPLPPTLELEACYRYCEALCRSRRHNYPVASLFTRAELRRHVFALFAFARVADDFADEPAYEGRRVRELDRWEEQLHSAYRGHAEHPRVRRARRHGRQVRAADHAAHRAFVRVPD
jgi:phytoene/squalene synthetase